MNNFCRNQETFTEMCCTCGWDQGSGTNFHEENLGTSCHIKCIFTKPCLKFKFSCLSKFIQWSLIEFWKLFDKTCVEKIFDQSFNFQNIVFTFPLAQCFKSYWNWLIGTWLICAVGELRKIRFHGLVVFRYDDDRGQVKIQRHGFCLQINKRKDCWKREN